MWDRVNVRRGLISNQSSYTFFSHINRAGAVCVGKLYKSLYMYLKDCPDIYNTYNLIAEGKNGSMLIQYFNDVTGFDLDSCDDGGGMFFLYRFEVQLPLQQTALENIVLLILPFLAHFYIHVCRSRYFQSFTADLLYVGGKWLNLQGY